MLRINPVQIKPNQATRDAAGALLCNRIIERMEDECKADEAIELVIERYAGLISFDELPVNISYLIKLDDMSRNYWSPVELVDLKAGRPRLVAVNG